MLAQAARHCSQVEYSKISRRLAQLSLMFPSAAGECAGLCAEVLEGAAPNELVREFPEAQAWLRELRGDSVRGRWRGELLVQCSFSRVQCHCECREAAGAVRPKEGASAFRLV